MRDIIGRMTVLNPTWLLFHRLWLAHQVWSYRFTVSSINTSWMTMMMCVCKHVCIHDKRLDSNRIVTESEPDSDYWIDWPINAWRASLSKCVARHATACVALFFIVWKTGCVYVRLLFNKTSYNSGKYERQLKWFIWKVPRSRPKLPHWNSVDNDRRFPTLRQHVKCHSSSSPEAVLLKQRGWRRQNRGIRWFLFLRLFNIYIVYSVNAVFVCRIVWCVGWLAIHSTTASLLKQDDKR